MQAWQILLFCVAAAALHYVVNFVRLPALSWANVILHAGAIVALLLLEATLRQVFIFLAASVACNMFSHYTYTLYASSKQKKQETAAGVSGSGNADESIAPMTDESTDNVTDAPTQTEDKPAQTADASADNVTDAQAGDNAGPGQAEEAQAEVGCNEL